MTERSRFLSTTTRAVLVLVCLMFLLRNLGAIRQPKMSAEGAACGIRSAPDGLSSGCVGAPLVPGQKLPIPGDESISARRRRRGAARLLTRPRSEAQGAWHHRESRAGVAAVVVRPQAGGPDLLVQPALRGGAWSFEQRPRQRAISSAPRRTRCAASAGCTAPRVARGWSALARRAFT